MGLSNVDSAVANQAGVNLVAVDLVGLYNVDLTTLNLAAVNLVK